MQRMQAAFEWYLRQRKIKAACTFRVPKDSARPRFQIDSGTPCPYDYELSV